MLTPEQKQRILTATGWIASYSAISEFWCLRKGNLLLEDGNHEGIWAQTERAAWDSWEPDANWCFREALPYLAEQSDYDHIEIEEAPRYTGWLVTLVTRRLKPDNASDGDSFELAFCTAFDTYLLERDGNK